MHRRRAFPRVVWILVVTGIAALSPSPVWPQTPAHDPQHQHQADSPMPEHDEQEPGGREGSGTAWLPDTTPMYAIHTQRGPWQLMAHDNVFVQFLHESGTRGTDQFGSINWIMGMARRDAGPGRVTFRGMFSAEPATIRGCGYPDLLASGEHCKGERIHDLQHPHDLMMEIAGQYDAPLEGAVRWQVYGGPVGEPALGPVAYPHRISAMPNPLAPIAHHWLDSTHITYGVVTAAVYGPRWKAEGSVFNGREPDERRTDFDFGALDSLSGRLWFMPSPNLTLQFSAGRLIEAEEAEANGTRLDVTRTTASATYHRMFRDDSIWATTAAWGRNDESGHGSNALLVETNVTFGDRDSWFGRFEAVGKTAHDLALEDSGGASTVAKLQGGYTRYLSAWKGLKPGVGATASAGFVPEQLKAAYGSRVNAGFGVFVTLRPAAMMMMMTPMHMEHGAPAMNDSQHAPQTSMEHPHPATSPPSKPSSRPPGRQRPMAPAEAPPDEPRLPVAEAERVVDPACAATIDLAKAPKATYQRKVYYFCSTADRDEFVRDPAAYLKKRSKSS